MTEKVSFEQVLAFRDIQSRYAQKHEGKVSKFLFLAQKAFKATKEAADEFEDRRNDINLEHVEKDKAGFALVDKVTVKRFGQEAEQDKFKYTTSAQKKHNEAMRNLLRDEVEVEVFQVKEEDIPEDIDMTLIDAFTPFLFPKDLSEDVLNKLIERSNPKKK